VEHGGLEDREVVAAADRRDERRDLDRVIDVRRLMVALAPLVAMFAGGEGERFQEISGGRQETRDERLEMGRRPLKSTIDLPSLVYRPLSLT
jgi:hypothetical protein